MQYRNRKLAATVGAILAGVSINALTTSGPQAQYKMTVNKERLLNAANEPQNWLMMNGDYNSHRYSKLTDQEAATTAISIWTRINLLNLHENILPTRQRAHLILRKGENHLVDEVALRRL